MSGEDVKKDSGAIADVRVKTSFMGGASVRPDDVLRSETARGLLRKASKITADSSSNPEQRRKAG